jgi:sarcosine oxidase subunit alpha
MPRLPPQPGEVIDRGNELHFAWNGRAQSGYRGDTIVSALAAEGVQVFSRSLKYHRPRGILTASSLDPNTLLQVDDEPNVRAGQRLLAAGMRVWSQNTWPSLGFDIKGANSKLARFLAPGFYYKTFMAPRALAPLYQGVLRRFINAGQVSATVSPERFEKRHAHPDVLVAGGGPAGMAAALAAAAAGAAVLLIEEEHELGGHLRYGAADELATLAQLRASVAAQDRLEVLTNSVVSGRYDHNLIAIEQRDRDGASAGASDRLIKARAKTLVVAAGTIERPYVFAGNDLPGVMLSTAVRRLINLYAVAPGRRAVVVSANASGAAAVADLERAGVTVVEVVGAESLLAARGRGRLTRVQLDSGRSIAADLLITATGWTTPTSLLNMAGDRPAYARHAARFLPTGGADDVLATGGMVGDGSVQQLLEHGAAIGAEAADRAARLARKWQAATPAAVGPSDTATQRSDVPARLPLPALPAADHPELFRGATHGIVDFSEDISSKDLIAAAREGYDSMELNKRYTTATMGPMQGKLAAINALAIVAEATDRTIAKTATTTWRPPYAPISLGVLAGRNLEPVRTSPLQGWHAAHGATTLIAGQWLRPNHYGDPAAEVRNVRAGVGIIDVSPLGKIDLRGRDVAKLLNFVYVNKWSKLPVGAVRYGVMCAEDGVVLDDGVVGHLSDDHYLMSTTSSGAATVWNWLDEWLQTSFPEWDVTMTAVSDGYASVNVAGPRSRELLSRITDVDLDPTAFPYMRVRTGAVAGVAGCVLWRIGFTGELSYELQIPAGYALHVWKALLAAGADLAVAPFGIEAQRIMRLEKGHFIVGQDTDGLTQAYGAGLDWAIKLDKEDFAGRPELMWQAERNDFQRLVALQPVDPKVVPDEGCQIVEGTHIHGRITSSRMSPTLDRSICLAMLDPQLAHAGQRVRVRLVGGREVEAVVMQHHAHVDPEGTRLHG